MPKAEYDGSVSDGYHTFDELYEHRHWLFLHLLSFNGSMAWAATYHEDGSKLDGWFVAGIRLPDGAISYHLPDRLWPEVVRLGITQEKAPQRAPRGTAHT